MEGDYFKMSADVGITKHIGGAKGTDELMELCHVTKDSYILEVGCGVGFVSSYIAKKYGCKIVSIDILPQMVEIAKEKAKKNGLLDQIEFKVASAEDLPFKDNTFDAVITESVTAFTNMKKSIPEYIRVTKKGGYVGLSEVTYFKDTPKEVKELMYNAAGGIRALDNGEWEKVMNKTGLVDITCKSERMKVWSQAYQELRLYGVWTFFSVMGKAIKLYFGDSEFRRIIKETKLKMKNRPKGFMKQMGHFIGVGKKK